MYDDNQSPYRCPICLARPSLCTEDPSTGMKTVGCLTCNCEAPVFTQRQGEPKYMPLIEWDKWVVKYRNEHKNWHKDCLCKKCLRDKSNCEFYDPDYINCPDAVYEEEL